MTQVRQVAAIRAARGTETQPLLAALVAEWRAAGARIVGFVGELHGLPDRTCGAGFLRDVAFDKPYPIYLEEPASGKSCHLDAPGVSAASAALLSQIPGSDLVVLNKFGKLEAMGEGLPPAFRLAIDAGKPLLTTVSATHRDAWCAFVPGALELDADKAALRNWWRAIEHTDRPVAATGDALPHRV
ncbi:MAG TPA: DUF2478 domain-containing protein [Xanthobacteraceae bacterium]|jgi:hypothetical protein